MGRKLGITSVTVDTIAGVGFELRVMLRVGVIVVDGASSRSIGVDAIVINECRSSWFQKIIVCGLYLPITVVRKHQENLGDWKLQDGQPAKAKPGRYRPAGKMELS